MKIRTTAIVLTIALLTVLAPASGVMAHPAEGDLSYRNCAGAISNGHGWWGIDASTGPAGVAGDSCRRHYVGIVWNSGLYYSSCYKYSNGNRTVTISSNDIPECEDEGPINDFLYSVHRVKAWDYTWSDNCYLYDGSDNNCYF